MWWLKLPFTKFTGMRLYRYHYGKKSTQGVLLYKGEVFYTIELPWKGNERRVSCIPEGTYDVVRRSGTESLKFRYDHIHILDVKGRDWILFHVANYPRDILGCIGTGLTAQSDFVGSSKKAHTKLMDLFKEKDKLLITKL